MTIDLIKRPLIIAVTLLLIPLIAMQFSREVNWDETDFIVMGILLFMTSMAYELIARRIANKTKRTLIGLLILLAFLYTWAELAVGIFTNLGS